MRRVPNVLLAVPALVFAAGCGSTKSADEPPQEPVAQGKSLGESLTMRDPRTGEEGGAGYLEVTLANPGSERITTRCAPEWYDAKGAVVAAGTGWRDVDLEPGKELRVRFAPMPASARSWRLRFAS